MLTLQSVAEELSLPEDTLLQQSLTAFLLREISLIEAEIGQLRERYAVLQPVDLKEAISAGRVVEHPAWEDYIDWQNGIEAIQSIRTLLTESTNGSTQTLSSPAFSGIG